MYNHFTVLLYMAQRQTTFALGEYYHLYNRGNSKQAIFKDPADYQRFLALLYLANNTQEVRIDNLRQKKENPFTYPQTAPLIAIGAYCLMPNHFHLLITPRQENGVSLFMRKLGTGYAMYFNKRYERTGTLFEGRFKAKWADSDEYLQYLFSYIYLNPMKLHDAKWQNRAMEPADQSFLESYKYCSYFDLAAQNARPEASILTTSAFPDYFKDAKDPKLLADWFQQGPTLLK
jgi:putative transposase